MSDFYSSHLFTSLPPQKLSLKKKGKQWREQSVDAICSMSGSRMSDGRSSWKRKQTNYNLVNSIFDEEDTSYVTDPWGLKDKASQPARMRDINLIVNKLNLLKGEEINRKFEAQVIATNGEAVSNKEKMKKDMLLYVAQVQFAKAIGIDPAELEAPTGGEVPQDFPEVDKWAQYNYKDIREQWGNDILTYIKHKENLKLKFNEGWEHALIAAEEIYYVGIVNGDVKIRVCNPLNCEFDRNPDNPWIQDGDWFREDRWMTAGQILDEFGEYLTEAQVKELDEGIARPNINGMMPGFAYTQSDISHYEGTSRMSGSHYLVSHCVWKSMHQIGFVTFPDENGEEQSNIVDETFELTPEMEAYGVKVEWRWIPYLWRGTKIGDGFYGPIEPMPNQTRSMDNPSEVKLPYIGRIYNSTNSAQTSLVDLLKPHQYLYNIVWYRLELELAKAKGKKFIMDIAQIPKSEGIDLDKWIQLFDNVGIAFINSFEEGKGKNQDATSKFNQFNAVDMSLSQAVGQYINILGKIEQLMDKVVGITPQREGATSATETASGVERSVTQSSHITEPWFYIHNEIKKVVYTQVIETSKFAFPNKKKLHFIVDDVQRISTELDMEKFADSDYGVFVSDSSNDTMIFKKLESLAEKALSSGAVSFSDVITMYKSNSISELSGLIRQSEAAKHQRDQQQVEMQKQTAQMQLQAQAEERELDRQFEREENQKDRDARLEEAIIKTIGFDTDTADSGALEAVEQGKVFLEQQKLNQESTFRQREMDHERNENDKDRALKEKEIAAKEKIEKIKLSNKTSGEK
jgi:hypothetical protein